MSLTIGVDVGGTKVLGAVVDPLGEVVAETRRPTPTDSSGAVVEAIVEVVRELADAHEVVGVGIGAAAWIDRDRSTVLFAPNVVWRNEPLRARVESKVNLPVTIENDANVAAWAEFVFGAARDADDSMALFTIGTGIGGGLIIGGQLLRGAHGIAAELGHTMVDPDGPLCGCGRHGCVEPHASGTALVRYARENASADPDSAKHLLGLADGSVEAIKGPMVTRAAQAGDPASLKAFDTVARWLSVAMVDIVQVIDPQVIVIGGGVVESGDLLVGPTRQYFYDGLAQRGRLPVAEVRPALMGNHAGVIGASDLARRI